MPDRAGGQRAFLQAGLEPGAAVRESCSFIQSDEGGCESWRGGPIRSAQKKAGWEKEEGGEPRLQSTIRQADSMAMNCRMSIDGGEKFLSGRDRSGGGLGKE